MEITQNLIVTDELLDSLRSRIAAGDDEYSRDSMAKVAWMQAANAKSSVDYAVNAIKSYHASVVAEAATASAYAAEDRTYTSSIISYASRLADLERDRVSSLKQLEDAMRILVAGGYVGGVESFVAVSVA
jgi:hypothetical protein